MQSLETEVTISTSRISDNGSLMASPSKSKKSQKKISNVARVMFQEPSWSRIDQNHKSRVPLLEISSTSDEQLRHKVKDISDVSFEKDVADDSINRNAVSYGRNIEKIPKLKMDDGKLESDSYDALKEIEIRTRKQLASQIELSRPPSGPLKRDDQFINKIGGSTQRSTGFLGYTIEGMLAQYPGSRPRMYLDEVESALCTTNETSATTSGTRTRFSENIGVRSMIFDPPQSNSLPILEATAFAVILQEALDFLDILEHIIPAPVDESWDDSYKTIDERYGTLEELGIMFREEMGFLPLIPTVSQKIQRDRTYIYNILKGTNRDIKCLRRYDRLEVEIDDIVRILEGEHSLEINHEIWMGQVKQLQELIEFNRIENEEEAKKLLASTQQMNSEVDNVTFLNNSKLGYVERWEEARLEQQKLRLEMKEQELNDTLGEYEKMERADQIVSGEVRTFLQANTKDLEDETVVWTSRCNEEVERLEQEINDMKEKIEFQKLELENLYELYDERQAFLNECYEEKERIKNEAEYWDAVNDAATVIQRLWRGYIVRHQLGQYKNLWATLKKRKRRAAITRKKNEEWGKRKAAEWGSTELKKLKNLVDPNA